MPEAKQSDLDKLQELLSLTEPIKDHLNQAERDAWLRIYAEVADDVMTRDHEIEQGLRMFTVNEGNDDPQYLYVDVMGRGSVCIKAEDDGIVVDVFPFHVVDAPVASCWASMSDLTQDDEEEEER